MSEPELGFWPEVFLCARLKTAITFTPISDEVPMWGHCNSDLEANSKSKYYRCVPVDGNHDPLRRRQIGMATQRLIRTSVLLSSYDLSSDNEIQLFKDINKNQKPMNTSHLDNIEVRLPRKYSSKVAT